MLSLVSDTVDADVPIAGGVRTWHLDQNTAEDAIRIASATWPGA